MARMARAVAAGVCYHLTHRGNRRGEVFLRPDDFTLYLLLLRESAARWGLDVWAYCLMTNHAHLLVVPRREDSLARAIGRAHGEYARRVHRREGWTGHLWAGRFYSCALDGPHLWRAARYIELNPLRAGLAARPEAYAWSSARAHVTGAADALLSPARPFPGPVKDWGAWLSEGLTAEETARLRLHTRTGRPLGSKEFVAELEETLGRPLSPQRRGRKPRPADEEQENN